MMAATLITDTTPITTPSMVSAARSLCARRAAKAVRRFSFQLMPIYSARNATAGSSRAAWTAG